MPSTSIESNIMCPFYVREGKTTICCEGILPQTLTVQKFTAAADKAKHEVRFCCRDGGRRCPHYRAVSLNYAD